MESLLKDKTDDYFIREALKEAKEAFDKGEVPVGAVLAHNNKIIARGHNLRETLHDPTAHAEMIAITQAAEHFGNWRLNNVTLYATLELCPMCAGAVLQGRIPTVVYGATDPVGGACGSVFDLFSTPSCNHTVTVRGSVLEEECGELLRSFFRSRRRQNQISRN